MMKQVHKSHYRFNKYVDKARMASLWHQLDEILRSEPERVLEIGPGPGLFKAAASALGVHVETLDIDSELSPDHVASVLKMPFKDSSFDVVCAFQMLEHMPFEDSCRAFREMVRVCRREVIISLPDAATRWPYSIYIPKFGQLHFSIPRPRIRPDVHYFDGEHYWEINKAGFSLKRVVSCMERESDSTLYRTFRVPENLYHRFFVFRKNKIAKI